MPYRPLTAIVATALAMPAIAMPVAAAVKPPLSYVGTYTSTDADGSGVRHTIITIGSDHTLTMHVTMTRHMERPVPLGIVKPVVESGTWQMQGSRLIFHVVSTTVSAEGGDQAPKFQDIAFLLEGCELKVVQDGGNPGSMEFDKRDCSVL